MHSPSISISPRLYLGTMTFGWSSQTSSAVDETVAMAMVQRCCQHLSAFSSTSTTLSIDTARIYSQGLSESYCGHIRNQLLLLNIQPHVTLSIGTKAHPTGHSLGLSPIGIQEQFRQSCIALQTNVLDEYYLHQPDVRYPLEDSLQYMNQLVQEGRLRKYGLSNYHASEVQRAFDLCETHHWIKPSLYQGLYNPFHRTVELQLIPLLEQHNCSFIAYNPLAGGLLTGKHTEPDSNNSSLSSEPIVTTRGRFMNNPNYIPRFFNRYNFKALDILRQACFTENITLVEATFRWLLLHSSLVTRSTNSSSSSSTTTTNTTTSSDSCIPHHGLLLGASSLEQLDENIRACESVQPLSSNMLQAMEEAWEITKDHAFPYWRSYSADMPNRESLDPGASYSK